MALGTRLWPHVEGVLRFNHQATEREKEADAAMKMRPYKPSPYSQQSQQPQQQRPQQAQQQPLFSPPQPPAQQPAPQYQPAYAPQGYFRQP